DHLAKRHRDERRPDQHPDHQVAELPCQEGQRRDGFGCTQRIGSKLLQALYRLGGCQALLDIRAELGSEYGDRLAMPALACLRIHWGVLLLSPHWSSGRLPLDV